MQAVRQRCPVSKKLPYLLPSLIFFLAAPVIWILCFREVPLRISPNTTFLTEPKTANGICVDYFAAIKEQFEPKCRPDENGFRLVVQALGKSPYFDEPDWYWESLCKELDLDPNLTPTLKFEAPKGFFNREYLFWLDENEGFTSEKAATKKPDDPKDTEIMADSLRNVPWVAEEFPFMQRWVEENSPLLDLVAGALRQKHYFVPMLRAPAEKGQIFISRSFQSNTALPEHLGDAFMYRLQYRLGKDDIDGALRDAASLSRMRIYSGFELLMSPRLFVLSFEKVLRNRTLSSEQKQKFLAELNSLPERESVKQALARWRLLALWYVAVYPQAFPKENFLLNWNLIAAETNRYYDQLERAWKQIEREPSRRQEIVDDLRVRLTAQPERSMLGKWLGKPVTVSGRSKEFAWAHNQVAVLSMLELLLETQEKALEELCAKIRNSNE